MTPDRHITQRLEQGESGEERGNSETLNEGINGEITLRKRCDLDGQRQPPPSGKARTAT